MAAYSVYVIIYLGFTVVEAGQSVMLYILMLLFTVIAALLSGPVTASHAEEPIVHNIPWHKLKVWSLHEDFHLMLAVADACWFLLALDHA